MNRSLLDFGNEQLRSLIQTIRFRFFERVPRSSLGQVVDELWARVVLYRVRRNVGGALHTKDTAEMVSYLNGASSGEIPRFINEWKTKVAGEGFWSTGIGVTPEAAETLYVLVRATKPRALIETGVNYGLSSLAILRALEANGEGMLHSIEIAPKERVVVPRSLSGYWERIEGSSAEKLIPLLTRLRSVDFFLHDSAHDYANVEFELTAAWRAVRPGGVILVDDALDNFAFSDFVRKVGRAPCIRTFKPAPKALAGLRM